MSQPRNWEVTAFQGNSSEAKTIRRIHDGKSFSIGDHVTDGNRMHGHIEKFDYSFKSDSVFVYTDWSKVGFSLDGLEHFVEPDITAKLVSFGNYLFQRYGIMVHSDEGQNVPMYPRQVSDADLQNWNVGQIVERSLPSAHQIGEKVVLSFGATGQLTDCEVIKVHFSESKVLYDVEVSGNYDSSYDIEATGDKKWHTRLYNVDSCFVTKPKK